MAPQTDSTQLDIHSILQRLPHLLLTSRLQRSFKGIWRFSALARMGDDEAAHAHLMVAPDTGK